MNRALFIILFFVCSKELLGLDQPKKSITANRSLEEIKIDAHLDEMTWSKAETANEFIQLEPNPGLPGSQKTEAKIIYDDQAIYIAGICYEKDPSLISKQLFERDGLDDEIESDWFGVAFDTYMDGNNGFAFFVSPCGVQQDVKFAADDDDENWDAVWESAVRLTENGWVIEMKIPYSALRFPDLQIQQWHFQIGRFIFRNQEEAFWNPIDPKIDGFLNQAGVLNGIQDIKSPVRLSATPFLAVYAENYYDKNTDPTSSWGRSFNGGMDVRYGISDAFTLDMTLIPDFGQVQSDNEVLNLTPFEVQFDENRQFFTEGTELFSKGDLFYTRRVGGVPLYRSNVEDELIEGERILENPTGSQLINATKLSGRTSGGTGIGFFNAISKPEYALVESLNGTRREILTNPLINYNVFVIDQNLPNNSYLSFINTNVLRSGSTYDANVTGLVFDFNTKTNTYSFTGDVSFSQKYYSDSTEIGHKFYVEYGKRSGNTIWELGYKEESHDYDPNDLGFLLSNNKRLVRGFAEYNIWEPFGRFNKMEIGFLSRLGFLQKFPGPEHEQFRDNLFTDFALNAWWGAETKNFWYWEFWTFFKPTSTYDYFEPRVDGRFYERSSFYNFGFHFTSDQRKKFFTRFSIRYEFSSQMGRDEKAITIAPEFRVSDKISLAYHFELNHDRNTEGYVAFTDTGEIIFGRRNVTDQVSIFKTKYIFNKEMSLDFRLRHNWTRVKYNSFHELALNGKLEHSSYDESEDLNFNAFTIDATYRWRFAPGSDIFFVWKNSVFGLDETSEYEYFENLENLFDNPIRNSLSIKFIYYLDYLRLSKTNRNS